MAKKQLRTVKKSNQTGRLNRDDVRSVVIDLRDGRDVQGAAAPPFVPRSRPRAHSLSRNSLIIAA